MNQKMQYAITYSLTFIFVGVNIYFLFVTTGINQLTHLITTFLLVFYLTRARFIWPEIFLGRT